MVLTKNLFNLLLVNLERLDNRNKLIILFLLGFFHIFRIILKLKIWNYIIYYVLRDKIKKLPLQFI